MLERSILEEGCNVALAARADVCSTPDDCGLRFVGVVQVLGEHDPTVRACDGVLSCCPSPGRNAGRRQQCDGDGEQCEEVAAFVHVDEALWRARSGKQWVAGIGNNTDNRLIPRCFPELVNCTTMMGMVIRRRASKRLIW